LIIDSHFHLGACRVFSLEVTEDEVRRALDEYGIDRVIVQPFPGAPDPVGVHNRIADLAASTDGQVVGLASLNPHVERSDYEAEIRRCVEDLGFVGVKLHTLGHAVHPKSDDAQVVFETAAMLGVAVMVHTGPGMPFSDPALLIDRAVQFPETAIVLAHAGASVSPATAIAVARQCGNVYLEPSWCRAAEARAMINAIGAERVMFGSDTPINLRVEFAKYDEIGLTDDEKAAVFEVAATKAFCLDPPHNGTEGGGD
jgi:predicted TIM-barrel fold metal-dependent hydrolase